MTENQTYRKKTLAQLTKECQQQINAYQKKSVPNEKSLSCLEIVRRAASNVQDALGAILEINRSFIYARCTGDLYEEREDISQVVSIRLIEKFKNRLKPFQVTDFASYRRYVKLTIESVIIDLGTKSSVPSISLEESQEEFGPDYAIPSEELDPAEILSLREQVGLVLDQLNPLEKEILIRRYVDKQSVKEIVADLALSDMQFDSKRAYRILERAKERLLKNPKLRHMMEL